MGLPKASISLLIPGLALLASLACDGVDSVWAREDIVPGSRYTAARAAALGDAFIQIGEDGAAALFYNPAAVAKAQKTVVEPINLQFSGNSGYLSLINFSNLGFYKVTSLSSYLSTLQSSPGTFAGVGASLLPNFSMRGFAAGMLIDSRLSAKVNADGTVTYRSRYQLIPAVSLGARLAGGIVRIGYTLQWVNQASGTVENVSAASDPLGYNQNLKQGSAFSHNFGMTLTLPNKYLPSFSIVARNVLGANYRATSLYPFTSTSTGAPDNEPMTLDGGFSLQPKTGNGGYFNLSLQYRDMTNTSQISLFGRLAAGIEFSYRDQFYLRGGWGSGYPAAGVGLRRPNGEFALTWFSEEIGTSYHALRDTRFMMQYQVRAF